MGFQLRPNLIQFPLKERYYFPYKVEGCHLKNGGMTAWEKAVFGGEFVWE
jgi:hypothetical protein